MARCRWCEGEIRRSTLFFGPFCSRKCKDEYKRRKRWLIYRKHTSIHIYLDLNLIIPKNPLKIIKRATINKRVVSR